MRWGSLKPLDSHDKRQAALMIFVILAIILALWLDAQDRVLGIL